MVDTTRKGNSQYLGIAEVRRTDANVNYIPAELTSVNRFFFTETFDSWTKVNVDVTEDVIASPFGDFVADKIECTAASPTEIRMNLGDVGQSLPVGYTFAIWLKKGSGALEANTMKIRNASQSTDLFNFTINHDTGAIDSITTGDINDIAVYDDGDGWFRYLMFYGTGVTGIDEIRYSVGFGGDTPAIGEYCYAFGAQGLQGHHLNLPPFYTVVDLVPNLEAIYTVLFTQLIAGSNIVGVNTPGPVTIQLPLEATEEQVITVSDERGTADVDNIITEIH